MEVKRQHIIQELLDKGISKSKTGKSIYDMDYEELKYELVLAAFRDIDSEKDANKWF
jgi:hypothetical protein